MRTTAHYNTIKIQGRDLIPFCIGQNRYMDRNSKVYNEMNAYEQMNFEGRSLGLTIYTSIINLIAGTVAAFGALKLSGLDKLLF